MTVLYILFGATFSFLSVQSVHIQGVSQALTFSALTTFTTFLDFYFISLENHLTMRVVIIERHLFKNILLFFSVGCYFFIFFYSTFSYPGLRS